MTLLPEPVLLHCQLGYWIVEDLVDRTIEHYPRGGLKYLVCYKYPAHLVSDVRSSDKWSQHAPRSGNTSHPGSPCASWGPGSKPDVRGEVRIFLSYLKRHGLNGNLMPRLKLYEQPPVLR